VFCKPLTQKEQIGRVILAADEALAPREVAPGQHLQHPLVRFLVGFEPVDLQHPLVRFLVGFEPVDSLSCKTALPKLAGKLNFASWKTRN